MSMLLYTYSQIPWVEKLCIAATTVINPVLILAAMAGIIYAVVVGIKFVKAEDKSQRDEAKQKLITVIIGVVVTIILVALFYFVAHNISSWVEASQTWGESALIGLIK